MPLKPFNEGGEKMKFNYCPECGGSNLENSRWFFAGNGKIKICVDCEKAYSVFDESDQHEDEIAKYCGS
ncbi:hypothetical protein [Gracilibacillus dipsosauri]|uniref:hypothetical protein n=1 Tax=Gracilibacillus dipsosauri TaxID=178340 RepID=UPI00240A0AF1